MKPLKPLFEFPEHFKPFSVKVIKVPNTDKMTFKK